MQTLTSHRSHTRPVRNRRGMTAAAAALVLMGLGGAGVTLAQTGQPHPQFAGAGQVQMADIVEQVKPSVVNIVATRSVQRGPAGPGMDPRMEELLRRFMGPGMRNPHHGKQSPKQSANALGSGFIIDSGGHVVTNNHVVDGAEQVQVVLDDGTTLSARVVGQDPRSDLAVLKVDSDTPLPALSFGDSDQARVGEWVIAIGNPFGLGGTATAGIISARGRDIRSGPYDDYLQIDAPINRGNSGGPVFDASGQVIGINTAIYSPNGGSVGIGFAIPSAQAGPIVAQLMESGRVTRGWLGVQIQPVTDDISDSLGLEKPTGALVTEVTHDSPASKAGLEVTDVIVAFDDKPVDDARDLGRLVAATSPEQEVPVTVWRQGRKRDLDVTVGTLAEPEQEILAKATGTPNPGKLGLKVAPLDERARQQLRLDDSVQGALVTSVTPDSPAARQGIRPGDVITRLGQSQVTSPDELAEAVEDAGKQGKSKVLALVKRGNAQRFVALSLDESRAG